MKYALSLELTDPGCDFSIRSRIPLTETCDEQTPNLIIHVETTTATTQHMEMTEVIHQELDHKQLLLETHLMDAGYIDGENIVASQKQYGVELIGPVEISGSWQAKTSHILIIDILTIKWDHQDITYL